MIADVLVVNEFTAGVQVNASVDQNILAELANAAPPATTIESPILISYTFETVG
jgi:hypothetical protein